MNCIRTIAGVHTDGIIDDGEKQAEMLKALGLFKGTPDGFELDRGLKRVFNYKLIPSKDIKGNYDEAQAQILVEDYRAGRPEVEAEGYVEKNKEREQEFLDAAGY